MANFTLFPRRRKRSVFWLGLGVGIGAASYALLDPRSGATRRARLRDKSFSVGRGLIDHAQRQIADALWRMRGYLYEAKARMDERIVDDEILEERVRAQIGRPVSHPRALHVTAHDGTIELTGPILTREVQGLLQKVRHVRGVRQVVSKLDVHDTADKVPALQGPGSHQTH